MGFEQNLQKYPSAEVRDLVLNTPPDRIDQALQRPRLNITDFVALLSLQLTDAQLEVMAARAYKITRQRFGHTIQLYAPIYLSNECHNGCKYCGFSANNQLLRKTLSLAEIEREAELLHGQGFRHMLLTGEAPESAGLDYLEEAIHRVKSHCGSVSIEVFPMDTEGYRRMASAGVDGLTLYQETYDPQLYRDLHPYGPK